MFLKTLVVAGGLLAPAAAMAASPLQVYDSSGKIIGILIMQNEVTLKINNITVVSQVSSSGFYAQDASNTQFFHSTTDCSGTRYMDASGLPEQSQISSTKIYYPGMPQAVLAVQSIEVFNSGNDVDQPGQCVPFTGYSVNAGPVASVLISSLGFSAPFSVR